MRRLALRGHGVMNGRHSRVITAYGLVVLTVLLPAAARPQLAAAVPAVWAMIPGSNVFVDKGCGNCHRTRGEATATPGPDLAGLRASGGLYEMVAAMWAA